MRRGPARARVQAIAKAARGALDEPFPDVASGLAVQLAGRLVRELLRGITAEGTTVVVATHDRSLVALADRVVTIEDGHVVRTPG